MTGSRPIDPVAADDVRLVLRLDRHLPGTVDGYHGQAELAVAG